MALEVGSKLAHYAVTAKIGEGGMGEVWRARDTKLDRDVALKVLPEAFTSDPDRLARFDREAKVLASLNHPNIGHIYGLEDAVPVQQEVAGTEQDVARGSSPATVKALVLELVEGPTLADRIAEGPIPIDEALPIAKQIAEALEAAHEQGIIHRDLKPANVKVKADGTVKVLDFGLAKAFQPEASGASASESQTISLTAAATQMGMVIGTAAYMAPEQAKGLVVDKRADIWAYGAVLFEMLTGRKLFEASDVSEMLASVLVKDPDISSLGGHVPAHVRSVVRHCLVKDPTERLRDIGDVRLAMRGAFETAVGTTAASTAPVLHLWQRPLPATLSALSLVILTGLGVWSATRPTDPPAPPVRRFALDIGPASPIPFVNLHAIPAWSPDGLHLVYAANIAGTQQLYLRTLDNLEARPIPGTENASAPFFSPGGEWVGFVSTTDSGFELKRVPVDGGIPLTICECGSRVGATWLADGTIVVSSGATSGGPPFLHQVSEAGGTAEPLTARPEADVHVWPSALPGGTAVLFTIFEGAASSGPLGTVADRGQVAVLSLDTGEQQIVVEAGYNARYVSTGHLVFGRQDALWGVPFDPERLVTTGPEELLLQRVEVNDNIGAMALSVSNDGTLVYVSGAATGVEAPVSALVWGSRDGGDEPLQLPPRLFTDPRVSPEGSRVAVTVFDTEGGDRDIWVYDLASGAGLRLTREGDNSLPRWTSDGEHVVFSRTVTAGNRNLYRVRADGSSAAERLTTTEQDQGLISLSPDGQTAIFTDTNVADAAATWHIMSARLDTNAEPQPVVTGPFRQASGELSPDGRWLAYRSDEAGRFEIYVQPYPGPGPKIPLSINGGNWPMWAPDGQAVFYVSEESLMRRTFDPEPTVQLGSPEVVLDLRGYALGGERFRRQFDVAPDGERFLLRKAPVAASSPDETAAARLTVVTGWTRELLERVPVP